MHLSPQHPTNVRKNLHQFNILMQIFPFLKESFSLFYNLLAFFIITRVSGDRLQKKPGRMTGLSLCVNFK